MGTMKKIILLSAFTVTMGSYSAFAQDTLDTHQNMYRVKNDYSGINTSEKIAAPPRRDKTTQECNVNSEKKEVIVTEKNINGVTTKKRYRLIEK